MVAERTRGRNGDRGEHGEAVAAGLAELSGWAAALAWRDVPESARRRVARLFADDLAAIVAARAEPELGALAERIVRARNEPAFGPSGKDGPPEGKRTRRADGAQGQRE